MRSTELFKENIKILKPRVTHRVAANDPARLALHSTITSLLEEILDEDSTINSAVRRSPYSDALVQFVHKELAMPHDLQWQEEQKITWADIKSRSPNYVLIQGQDGTGAVKWDGSQWVVVLSSKEGVTKFSDGSINTLFKQIKETIGKVRGYWSAINSGITTWPLAVSTNQTGPVDVKRKERKDARTITNPNTLDPNAGSNQNFDAVMIKLLPLYNRYIQQAISDVKGVIGMAIKNDSYNKAKQKLQLLEKLKNTQEELMNNPKTIPEHIKTKLRPALYMTASHFYPEDTGNFTMSAGPYSSSGRPQNEVGPRKVISDIANGDNKKLVTLMNYLKQTLLHA
jgi:hypothetical protein